MNNLVLSIFPGIDLFGRAFEEEGFCIVRGPDVLWGGDIRNFHPPAGVFDGVIGGPPCQAFSRLCHLVEHNGLTKADNLIPEFERVVEEAGPRWFVMENVPAAPEPQVRGYWPVRSILMNNRWVGAEQNRVRRFSFGTRVDLESRSLDISPDLVALECHEWRPAVCASGGVKPGIPTDRTQRAKYLGWKTTTALKEGIRDQGLPDDFLESAPFTVQGKIKVIGNGVPLPMGRAIARAVNRAFATDLRSDAK